MIDADGIILAGGRSQRMGYDKAEMRLDSGLALWQQQKNQLQRHVSGQVWVSRQYGAPILAPFDLPDTHPDLGPLGGIWSGCRKSQAAWLAVLAVDLPQAGLSPVWQALAEVAASGQASVVMAGDGERVQPLAGLWATALSGVIAQYLGRGQRRVLELLHGIPSAVAIVDSSYLVNLNVPQDVEKWRAT